MEYQPQSVRRVTDTAYNNGVFNSAMLITWNLTAEQHKIPFFFSFRVSNTPELFGSGQDPSIGLGEILL